VEGQGSEVSLAAAAGWTAGVEAGSADSRMETICGNRSFSENASAREENVAG